jgi:phage terminase small subunit
MSKDTQGKPMGVFLIFVKGGVVMLTPRQEKFCLEYAKCGNATEAAIAAGYAEKYAGQNADKLLKNTKIQDRLEELRKQLESEQIADITEMQMTLTAIIRQQMEEEIPLVVNTGDFASEVQIVKKKPSVKDVVNAINSLGRMQGAFLDKLSVEVEPVVIVNDLKE